MNEPSTRVLCLMDVYVCLKKGGFHFMKFYLYSTSWLWGWHRNVFLFQRECLKYWLRKSLFDLIQKNTWKLVLLITAKVGGFEEEGNRWIVSMDQEGSSRVDCVLREHVSTTKWWLVTCVPEPRRRCDNLCVSPYRCCRWPCTHTLYLTQDRKSVV